METEQTLTPEMKLRLAKIIAVMKAQEKLKKKYPAKIKPENCYFVEPTENCSDDKKVELEIELEYLKDENIAMHEFFDELAIPIIKKAVRNVEKQLRRFPRGACQFGDDSKLNFFEEVCVMLQEVSMDDYMFVENTIESCCESAYDELSNQEKFILNHQTSSPEIDGAEIVKDEFFQYATEL